MRDQRPIGSSHSRIEALRSRCGSSTPTQVGKKVRYVSTRALGGQQLQWHRLSGKGPLRAWGKGWPKCAHSRPSFAPFDLALLCPMEDHGFWHLALLCLDGPLTRTSGRSLNCPNQLIGRESTAGSNIGPSEHASA